MDLPRAAHALRVLRQATQLQAVPTALQVITANRVGLRLVVIAHLVDTPQVQGVLRALFAILESMGNRKGKLARTLAITAHRVNMVISADLLVRLQMVLRVVVAGPVVVASIHQVVGLVVVPVRQGIIRTMQAKTLARHVLRDAIPAAPSRRLA